MKKTKPHDNINILKSASMPFEGAYTENLSKVPGWLVFYADVIKQYKRQSFKKLLTSNDSKDPVVAFVTPFINAAKIQLATDQSVFYNDLGVNCRQYLESIIQQKLVRISKYSLNKIALGESDSAPNSDADKISKHISDFYKNPRKLFEKHAVLARILSSHALYWVNSIKVLVKRLLNDYSEIRLLNELDSDNKSYKLIVKSIDEILINLSDPHENSQTVAVISFTDGFKVVYKPKSLKPEFAFCEFLQWINKHTKGLPDLKCLPVIDKKEYGWSKYIQHKVCADEESIELFYKRLGMFSAILYILRGTDYHYENIIAHASDPYFIDHEMLFYPIIIDPQNTELLDQTIDELLATYHESVINSRLYPIVENRIDGSYQDVSAIGRYKIDEKNSHLPFDNENYREPVKYVNIIVDGFRMMYQSILRLQEVVLAPNGPLERFRNVDFRFNFRATSSYLSINNVCVVPDSLINGEAYCARIHSVRVTLPSVFSQGLPPDIRLRELKVLSRLDVPRFTFQADKKSVHLSDDNESEVVFAYSGYELVRRRIQNLSQIDLDNQISYIRESLR